MGAHWTGYSAWNRCWLCWLPSLKCVLTVLVNCLKWTHCDGYPAWHVFQLNWFPSLKCALVSQLETELIVLVTQLKTRPDCAGSSTGNDAHCTHYPAWQACLANSPAWNVLIVMVTQLEMAAYWAGYPAWNMCWLCWLPSLKYVCANCVGYLTRNVCQLW